MAMASLNPYVRPMQKLLIMIGLTVLVVGLLWPFLRRMGIGRLPGDFSFTLGGAKIYVPLMTSLILSVILTIILRFFGR